MNHDFLAALDQVAAGVQAMRAALTGEVDTPVESPAFTPTPETPTPEPAPETPAPEPEKPAPDFTYETAREYLAIASRTGHADTVRDALTSNGYTRLSELRDKPDQLASLVAYVRTQIGDDHAS